MRLYEVLVIFHPGLESDGVRTAADRFGSIITERGGTVSRIDMWGRRRLAYEINHVRDGTYVVFELTSEPVAMDEFDRVLSLSDEVIRHKIVRLPEAGIPAVVPVSVPDEDPSASFTPAPHQERGERR